MHLSAHFWDVKISFFAIINANYFELGIKSFGILNAIFIFVSTLLNQSNFQQFALKSSYIEKYVIPKKWQDCFKTVFIVLPSPFLPSFVTL